MELSIVYLLQLSAVIDYTLGTKYEDGSESSVLICNFLRNVIDPSRATATVFLGLFNVKLKEGIQCR